MEKKTHVSNNSELEAKVNFIKVLRAFPDEHSEFIGDFRYFGIERKILREGLR